MPELFALLVQLAQALGHRDIKDRPGLLKLDVTDRLRAEFNPHREKIDHVPPMTWALYWGEFPCGLCNLRGGPVAAGSDVNERSIIREIEGALRKLGVVPATEEERERKQAQQKADRERQGRLFGDG